jgi:hypothetical protein
MALALLSAAASAQTDTPLPHNNYGSVGLIDMPSARMAPDGELSAGAFFTQNIQRYNLGFQALPWLETSFRYSGLQHFNSLYPVYFDRGFGAKIRFWQESDILPEVSIGVSDVVGTGIYGGEYLVASKQFGAVDATLGMGWGRLGSTALFKNPLKLISSSFESRRTGGDAGGTNFGTFFHGHNAALFGGLTWSTPLDGLSLIGEYSSDAYREETTSGAFRPHNQINLGVSYQLADSINVGVNWLYGRSVGASLSFQLDPVHDAYPQRIGPLTPEPRIRTAEERQVALETLLRPADAHTALTALHKSYIANGTLVDQLWRLKNLNDISLKGRDISLSFTQGDPGTLCRSVAQFMGEYTTTITRVIVSRGRESARCQIAEMPTIAMVNASFTAQNMGAVALADTPPLIIHADGRTAAGDKAVIAKIRADITNQNLTASAVALSATEAIVYYGNGQYFSETEAIDRLTRIMMADAPTEIEKFRFIAVSGGQPMREFTVLRAPAERSLEQTEGLDTANTVATEPAPMYNPVLAAETSKTYPHFSYFFFPQFRQQLFDPQNPFGVQILGAAESSLDILPGLSITGEVEANIFDTFVTNRDPDSVLPHVRTDFLKYFTEGKNGIGYLAANYNFRIAPTVFAAVHAGYLESMYAGVGGEVLWRPEGLRWAVGADLYDLQQRNFDRLFGLQNYHVVTGHISLYYASPWYDLNFALRAGQYLAKDRGFTFEITRRFSTGVEIGAFFTKTNVSAERFGEGSFDKGIILRIPLNWMAPVQSQGQFNLDLRPVQRDGGQRLEGDSQLFEQTRRTSYSEIWRETGRIE